MSRLFRLHVMPTITALQVQQRNKRRMNVYLDDAFAFGIAMNAGLALRVGMTLSAAEIAALKNADEVERAYERALRFLSYRARSETEVRRNLQQHKAPPDVIDAVLGRLRQAKYVDDAEFATLWVANRLEHRPRGRRALRAELRQKGIADELIEAAVRDVDDMAAARAIGEKRATRFSKLPTREFRNKMYGVLARRGFDSDTIRTVIRELIDFYAISESEPENED